MQRTKLDRLIELKKSLLDFLDQLHNSFPDEPDFVVFRIFVNDQIPIQDIMNYILVKLVPIQELVKKRNEEFFLNNNILFEDFDNAKTSRVNHFRNLWLSKNVDDDDRHAMWAWFEKFIFIAVKYSEAQE